MKEAGLQPRVGVYLAIEGDVAFPGCVITLVNQRKPASSSAKGLPPCLPGAECLPQF